MRLGSIGRRRKVCIPDEIRSSDEHFGVVSFKIKETK